MDNQADNAMSTLKNDMDKLFRQRLRTVIRDMAETAQIGGLPQKETIAVLMSGLIREFVMASTLIGLTQHEFVAVTREAYKLMYKPFEDQLMRVKEAHEEKARCAKH